MKQLEIFEVPGKALFLLIYLPNSYDALKKKTRNLVIMHPNGAPAKSFL